MEKLHVRLRAFIVLGTIVMCEKVAGLYPESVAITRASSAAPPLGCGPPKTDSVRFYEVKVKSNGEDVMYQRVTVTLSHLQFAMNASVSLPSNSFTECAKAAGRKGLEAFQFDGNCMGYQLTRQFLRCQTGDIVIYQRSDYFADVSALVSFDEAPYEALLSSGNDPYRKYTLYAFVETEVDHPGFKRIVEFDEDDVADGYSNVIFLENGEMIETQFTMLDVNFCFDDGSDGVPIALCAEMYGFEWPLLYFFQECGKTIEVTLHQYNKDMVILSHPGFGCKYYPTWLPDECTVIFEGEEDFHARFGFYFSESDSDGAGLIMTVSATSETGKTIFKNVYQANDEKDLDEYKTYNFSLQRQPSTRAIGFFIELH